LEAVYPLPERLNFSLRRGPFQVDRLSFLTERREVSLKPRDEPVPIETSFGPNFPKKLISPAIRRVHLRSNWIFASIIETPENSMLRGD